MALMVKLKLPTRVQPEVFPRPDRCGVHTNKIEFLKRQLLDKIPGKSFAPDFMQPVDSELLNVPAYYMIITDPMDVGTIIKRVQNQYYQGVDELIDDFRLVINNCFKFNRTGEVVYRKGLQLEKFFLKVLDQMPPGPEYPSSKNPQAERNHLPSENTLTVRERLCREDLKKLQNCYVDEVDKEVREFFKEKWCALSKRISKHAFKTLEDFHMTVDNIFLQSQEQAKRVYGNAFFVPLESISLQPHNKQLNELLYEVKRMDGSLRAPYNVQARWEQGLMDGIDFMIEKLSKKLDTCRQVEDERYLVGQEYWRRQRMVSSNGHKLMNVLATSYPNGIKAEPNFSKSDRHTMMQQFAMMPMHVKDEIMDIIARNEDITCDNYGLQWYDFENFNNETLLGMKKVMLPHTKLNLRNMNTYEKADLQRSLESRLETINQVLSGHRRKCPRGMRGRMPARKRARYFTNCVAKKSCSLQQQDQKQQRRSSPESSDDSDSSDSSSSSSDSTDRSDPSDDSL
ncbi:uncharacterized protein LOC117571306 [Drosophila albomicans]|uniref:Uncharacterized protein LOC117571306 n=1 Tax=Drosophila albomicans TaxID=7291 RepID=A0A6P8XCU1_DROAB|nr:uncharacterized protein LOC117571306 [Drosophila albomicans]XP_034109270.1 uncharacterized protein LOC117571306 [Drosophila albomicans]